MGTIVTYESLADEISNRDKIFYDLETFKHYACFCFRYEDDSTEEIEFVAGDNELNVESTDRLREIYENHILKNGLLIGYNNKKYDNMILLSLMYRDDPFYTPADINLLSREIIETETLKFVSIPDGFLSYDCYNFKNHMPSLKLVGTLFGGSIKETPYSFSYQGTFTEEMRKDVLQYCHHDTKITKMIFESELGQQYFDMENRMASIAYDHFKARAPRMVYRLYSGGGDHYETIINALTDYGYKAEINSNVDLYLPKCPDIIKKDTLKKLIPKQHWDKYENVKHFFYSEEMFRKRCDDYGNPRELECELLDGIIVKYGEGGLHGCTEKPIYVAADKDYTILHADFSAMYPSIMIAYDFYPPGLADNFKGIFEGFAKARDDYKKAGNVTLSLAYKPILNSVPGRFRYRYGRLNHPATNYSICALAQTLISVLSWIIKGKMIQVDTDGVMFVCRRAEFAENVKAIAKFCEIIKLKIKVEEFQWFAQQNIHAYAFADGEGNVDGIGGVFGGKSDWDPNLMGYSNVVQRALQSGETVKDCVSYELRHNGTRGFVFAVKTTAKFAGFKITNIHTDEEEHYEGRFLLGIAVNAEKARALGYKVYDIKKVGIGKVQKISGFPPTAILIEHLDDKVPVEIVDAEYYAAQILSKMKGISELVGIKGA